MHWLFVETISFYLMWSVVECIVLPTGSVHVSETRVGIELRRDSFPVSERVRGEAYRLQYPYFSNLVARTIEATSAHAEK